MKSWKPCCVAVLLLLPAVILCGRVALRAGRTETGSDVVADTARSVALGWLVGSGDPVQNRPPAEQAEFWIAETERILKRIPETAEVAIGAAWLLDAPSTGYLQGFIRPVRGAAFMPPLPEPASVSLDYEAIAWAEDAFEARCAALCLEQAERATRLNPQDVRWWRMRALLQFRPRVFNMELEPRYSEWLAVLDEAARHDPGNALYDYLAALQLWTSSASYEWSDEEPRGWYRLEVHDAERFAEGVRRFERGEGQEFFAFGETGWPAVAAFLDGSHLSRTDQGSVAASRLLSPRASSALGKLFRWQTVRADTLGREGRPREAAAALRQILTVIDQAEAGDETLAVANMVYPFRWIASARLRELREEYPEAIDEDELQRLEAESGASRLDGEVLQEVGRRRAARQGEGRSLILSAAALGLAAQLIAPLAMLGLLACGIGAWLLRRAKADRPQIGTASHPIAWGAGFGLSLAVLGFLAPDDWFAGWMFGTWPTELVRDALALETGSWIWAVLRFAAAYGHYAGAALSLGLVATWYAVRIRPRSGLQPPSVSEVEGDALSVDVQGTTAGRHWWGGLITCVGRSSLGMAYCLVLIALLPLPAMIENVEREHQQRMAWIRNPEAEWTRIRTEAQRIEADAEQMGILRRIVEDEAARRPQ